MVSEFFYPCQLAKIHHPGNQSQQKQTSRPQTILAALRHINETGKPSWEVCVFCFTARAPLCWWKFHWFLQALFFVSPSLDVWWIDSGTFQWNMIGSHGGNLYGFMLYIYISYIYIYHIYIYAHMYAVYIQSVLTYIFHLWGLSNVKVSLRRAEIASTANNGIIIIVDLFLFSVVFFPLVFIQSNLTKKDAQDELVFSFLCLSSLISLCYGQLPRCCNNSSAVTCARRRSSIKATLDLWISQRKRQGGDVLWCVVASLDLMIVTNWVLTKEQEIRVTNRWKNLHFWSVRQILSLKFGIELFKTFVFPKVATVGWGSNSLGEITVNSFLVAIHDSQTPWEGNRGHLPKK